MSEPRTFRDFASEIFAGNLDAASATLAGLLALDPARARAAAQHFQGKTADPSFLPRAMSLRTAIEGPDDAAVEALLIDCFALDPGEARASTAALRARYAPRGLFFKSRCPGAPVAAGQLKRPPPGLLVPSVRSVVAWFAVVLRVRGCAAPRNRGVSRCMVHPCTMKLTTVFLDDEHGRGALEAFIDKTVGVGTSNDLGTFDGLGRVRQVERGPDVLKLIGWIYTLERQARCAFWLDIKRKEENLFRWRLFLGSTEESPRRARNLIDLCERAKDTGWEVKLTGHGQLQDGEFLRLKQPRNARPGLQLRPP